MTRYLQYSLLIHLDASIISKKAGMSYTWNCFSE